MQFERLTNGYGVWIDEGCTFGTDALLLAAFAAAKPSERVCDLGTGCGVMPIVWQQQNGGPTVDAVECEPHAAALARRSVVDNGLAQRIAVVEQSWCELTLQAGIYDRVVCNPPYFPETSGKQSPSPARQLARHEQGDTLTAVSAAAARLLKDKGRFVLCHRPERLCDVLETLRAHKLEPKRLQWVHDTPDKPPFLLLCEAIKGAKPSLTVACPLYIKE